MDAIKVEPDLTGTLHPVPSVSEYQLSEKHEDYSIPLTVPIIKSETKVGYVLCLYSGKVEFSVPLYDTLSYINWEVCGAAY
jgi:hypothetical protein